jgi:PAS domain S-box-containing protein
LIPAKILVVEDESVVAWHVQEVLQRLGHEVVAIAQTAREAIRFASDKSPDLVLMDICLQDQTDGVSAAEHLYLQLDLPVVYLTAHADEQTLRRATETSPFGYLLKPFQEADLHSTIQIALRRHQLERALKDTQQWYATTLISIGDATIATDLDGFITFMNPTAELLTGWTQEEALGEFAARVVCLIREDTGVAIDNPILATLCQSDTITIPDNTLLKSRDDSERPIAGSASPVRNRAGEISGGILVFQDVGDRHQLEHQLREQNRYLEHLRSQQNEFMLALAQEIRTPLTNMRLAISMVQRLVQQLQNPMIANAQMLPSLWQKVEQYLHILQQEWSQEFELIHELLDFREGGAIGAPLSEVRLQDWLPLLIDRVEEPTASAMFQTEIFDDLPPLLLDLSALERLLIQLLIHTSQLRGVQRPILLTAFMHWDRVQIALMCESSDYSDAQALTTSHLRLVLAKKIAIELHAEIKVEQRFGKWCLTLALPTSNAEI